LVYFDWFLQYFDHILVLYTPIENRNNFREVAYYKTRSLPITW